MGLLDTLTRMMLPFLLLIFIFLASLPTCNARKALGGSGGLHTRGASRPKSTESNDPLKVASIGNGWQLPPLDSKEVIQKLGKEHRDVAQYIVNTLGNAPLTVQLRKNTVGVKTSTLATQEKYRAVVTPGSNVKKFQNKLRSVWFIGYERASIQSNAVQQQEVDVLTKSYEDNTAKIYPSHFVLEVFLPKTRACKGGNPLVTYSIPFGVGTTSSKSKVPQSNGIVTVYPNGRKKSSTASTTSLSDEISSQGIEVGRTSLHLKTGAGLVDPSWARGRRYFWKGRDVGTL